MVNFSTRRAAEGGYAYSGTNPISDKYDNLVRHIRDFNDRFDLHPTTIDTLEMVQEEVREFDEAAEAYASYQAIGPGDLRPILLRSEAADELIDYVWTVIQHDLYDGRSEDAIRRTFDYIIVEGARKAHLGDSDIMAAYHRVVRKNAVKTPQNGYRLVDLGNGRRKITNK